MKYKPAGFSLCSNKKTARPRPEVCAASFSVIYELQIDTTQRITAS